MHKSIYILVHGAWHGAWCWNKLAPMLRQQGHTVLTPDLPGHGDYVLPAKQVTLSNYCQYIVQLVRQQNRPVKLLGHSMAGMVISQVAEEIPKRIDELIYLAAYIPKSGDSLLSIAERSVSRGISPFLRVDQANGVIHLQQLTEAVDLIYSNSHPEDKRQAISKLQAQSLQPFAASVKLYKSFNSVRKKAIVCTQDLAILAQDQLAMCENVIDEVIRLEADHSAFFSCPELLFSALSERK